MPSQSSPCRGSQSEPLSASELWCRYDHNIVTYNILIFVLKFIITLILTAPYQRPIMPFKCHKCERSYKVKWSLQAHLIQKCGAVRAYACTLCDHRTVTKGNLRVHLCNTHDIDPSKLVSHGAGFDVLP